jgi:hypothetical protein
MAPSAPVVIVRAVQAEPSPAVFSYHAILSSSMEADSTSRSPSPSTSAAWTERAPSADVAIVCCGPKGTSSVHAGNVQTQRSANGSSAFAGERYLV